MSKAPATIAPTAGGPGTATRILGWGSTCEPGPSEACRQLPTALRELDTHLVDDAQCGNFDGKVELCTGGTIGQQGCAGDSGGPELVRGPNGWLLVGATSRDGTPDDTCANGTGVWTDVTAYRGWIDQTIGS